MNGHGIIRASISQGLPGVARAGVTPGLAIAAHPDWTVYPLAHVHMLLLGFVTMMIYGVAYHVLPRFAGYPLHNRASRQPPPAMPTGGWSGSAPKSSETIESK